MACETQHYTFTDNSGHTLEFVGQHINFQGAFFLMSHHTGPGLIVLLLFSNAICGKISEPHNCDPTIVYSL